jgi:hypothetical protein
MYARMLGFQPTFRAEILGKENISTMRKGFTLTLTTLAVAILATSVYALGPTVGAIPDVWITEKNAAGAADGPQYMFRYSGAFLLWDYVTPGVSTGDGSSSTTLFWAWALRQSNGTDGFGPYLSGAGVHYGIFDSALADVQSDTPTFSVSGASFAPASWVADVNGWAGKPSLADTGSLTFRNIRLNPTITFTNASPTSDSTNAQLPAGLLDCQEATIFVTDGATTPGFDMVNLVTLLSTATVDHDLLSAGGPSYAVTEDYRTSTSAFNGVINFGFTVAGSLDAARGATSATNNGTGTFAVTFPLVNNKGTSTTDPFFPAVLFTRDGVAVTASNIYRSSARVSSSNTSAVVNPSVRVDLNGRTTIGEGFGELSSETAAGSISRSPLSGSPQVLKGFLKPVADGTVQAFDVLWDTTDTQGGTLSMDQMLIESFDSASLTGANVIYDQGTGAATGIDTSLALAAPIAFLGTTLPTITIAQTPATGAAQSISFTGSSGVDGVGVWLDTGGTFTTAAAAGAKLVVVQAMVRTTSSETAHVPDFHMAVNKTGKNERAGLLINRTFSGATKTNDNADVTSTARPYCVVFEADPSSSYDVSMYAIVTGAGISGNLTVERLTATEYDLPTETH